MQNVFQNSDAKRAVNQSCPHWIFRLVPATNDDLTRANFKDSGLCREQKVGRACRATSLTRKAHPDSCTKQFKHWQHHSTAAVNGTAYGPGQSSWTIACRRKLIPARSGSRVPRVKLHCTIPVPALHQRDLDNQQRHCCVERTGKLICQNSVLPPNVYFFGFACRRIWLAGRTHVRLCLPGKTPRCQS